MSEDVQNKSDSEMTFMPDEELLYDLADFFKTFGDTTRVKILYALMEQDLCVADLAERSVLLKAPYPIS